MAVILTKTHTMINKLIKHKIAISIIFCLIMIIISWISDLFRNPQEKLIAVIVVTILFCVTLIPFFIKDKRVSPIISESDSSDKYYEKIYERIINGEHVAVWVDYDWLDGTLSRDIAAIKRFGHADINIGARGIQYGAVIKWRLKGKTEKQAFIEECKRLKLELANTNQIKV